MVAAFFEKCRTCGTDKGGLLETVVRFEMELRATLTGQQKALLEQFEKADTANAEALELKTQYEASLQGAKEEAIQIVADARERADVQYKQIVSDAEKRSADLLEKTNQDMEKERDRALQSVQKEIGTLAMAAAVKIIGENSSKVTDEQLYNEFLSKTGDKHDSNNG